MRRPTTTLIVICALTLTAGCGSSSNSASSPPATTSSSAAVGLKANTTPHYASPPASAQVQSGVVQIAYRNISISPDALKVKVGSTIRWTNYDSVEHNVTSKEGPQRFASKQLGENATFEVKLTRPGVIHYQCTIHPTTMNGTIEVVK